MTNLYFNYVPIKLLSKASKSVCRYVSIGQADAAGEPFYYTSSIWRHMIKNQPEIDWYWANGKIAFW